MPLCRVQTLLTEPSPDLQMCSCILAHADRPEVSTAIVYLISASFLCWGLVQQLNTRENNCETFNRSLLLTGISGRDSFRATWTRHPGGAGSGIFSQRDLQAPLCGALLCWQQRQEETQFSTSSFMPTQSKTLIYRS